MDIFRLEKDIWLYKNQFEDFTLNIFNEHKMERLSMDLDGMLFRIRYMIKHNRDLNRLPELREKFIHKALELRKVFGEIMYNILTDIVGLDKFSMDDIEDILAMDVKIDGINVKFKMILLSKNEEYLKYVDNKIPDKEVFNLSPDEFFRFYTDSYNDGIAKAYPELFENRNQNVVGTGNDSDVYCHNVTIQTSEACNLSCTYCYQFNKTSMSMDFDTAKKFIDDLISDKYGYVNRYNSPAIIIEFIGGEPFLEIDLTRKIYEYFLEQTYELGHPWFQLHRLSICSNGLLYFDERVQSFFKDYSHNISFNISIDGNRELHDACRIQPNGEGSYDVAMAALNHYNKYYTPERNSKMTLAPENIKYLFDSVVDFINNGMKMINLNCIFEEGWNKETALIEYKQLKKLADYILENDLENIYISIFDERQEDVQDKSYDGNFCFRGDMQILTESGHKDIKDIKIGDKVYTASGSIHKVVKMTKYHSKDNKKLRISGAFPVHCTSDHKIFAKKFLYNGWKYKIHYSEPGFYPVSELKVGDRVALPVLDISKNKPISWFTEELAYALGVYLADGYINRNTIIITPGYDEDKFYYNKLKEANLIFTVTEMRTSMRYTINKNISEENRRYFGLCVECGSGSYIKHMPFTVFRSPKNIIQKVLDGYLETDGYTDPEGTTKVNTVSQHLANDVVVLLRALGQYPTVYFYKRAGQMMIENRIVNVRDRYEVYYNPGMPNARNLFRFDDEFNVIWTGIKSIEDDESYDVYCPTVMPLVEDDLEEHSFILNGLATQNCGGIGSLLSLRPNGQFYPCIRYMPTSVGDDVPDLCLGDVDTGLVGREDNSDILRMMDNITRRSQSNDICFECPIGSSCAWCSASGHTVYGTPNKRPMFICIQTIAEALANVYYWNLLNIKKPDYKLGVRKNNVPNEWALLIISEDELDFLKKIEAYSMVITMLHDKK